MKGSFQFDRYRSTTAAFTGWLARRRIWKGRGWTSQPLETGTAVPMVLRNYFAFRPNLQIHNLAIQVAAHLHTHTQVTWWSPLYKQLEIFLQENQINTWQGLYQVTSLSTFQSRGYRILGATTLNTTRVRNYQDQVALLTTRDLRSHGSTVERIHSPGASIRHSWSSRAASWQTTNVHANAVHVHTSPLRQVFTGTSYSKQVMPSHSVSHVHFTIQPARWHMPPPVAAARFQTFVPVEHRTSSLLSTPSRLDKQTVEQVTTRTFSNWIERQTSRILDGETAVTRLHLPQMVHRILARSTQTNLEQHGLNTTWLYRRNDEIKEATISNQLHRLQMHEQEVVKRVQRTIAEQCDSIEKRITRQSSLAAEDLTEQVYSHLVRRLQVEKERLGR